MRKILNFMVLAVLLPALLIATVLLTYLHFFAPGDKNLSGHDRSGGGYSDWLAAGYRGD